MTIAKFIEKLKTFNQDLEIAVEWDGGWSDPSEISGKCNPLKSRKVCSATAIASAEISSIFFKFSIVGYDLKPPGTLVIGWTALPPMTSSILSAYFFKIIAFLNNSG